MSRTLQILPQDSLEKTLEVAEMLYEIDKITKDYDQVITIVGVSKQYTMHFEITSIFGSEEKMKEFKKKLQNFIKGIDKRAHIYNHRYPYNSKYGSILYLGIHYKSDRDEKDNSLV